MKYIKSFEGYKKKETINEEFIGGLLKKLKNKLSLSFSKNFGRAKDADKLMDEYKNEIINSSNKKNEILKQYATYIKENEEIDPKKTAELNKNYLAAESIYKQQVEISKQKFDIKFNEITEDEKNPKIKNYIQLKKLEMQQEILTNELNTIFVELKLDDEIVNSDPNFKNIVDSIQGKIKEADTKKLEQENILKSEAKESEYFSIKEEDKKKVEEKGGFVESPFAKGEVKLKQGDKVEYWSERSKKAFFATVSKVEEDKFGFTNKDGETKFILLTRVISKGEKPKEEAKQEVTPKEGEV